MGTLCHQYCKVLSDLWDQSYLFPTTTPQFSPRAVSPWKWDRRVDRDTEYHSPMQYIGVDPLHQTASLQCFDCSPSLSPVSEYETTGVDTERDHRKIRGGGYKENPLKFLSDLLDQSYLFSMTDSPVQPQSLKIRHWCWQRYRVPQVYRGCGYHPRRTH